MSAIPTRATVEKSAPPMGCGFERSSGFAGPNMSLLLSFEEPTTSFEIETFLRQLKSRGSYSRGRSHRVPHRWEYLTFQRVRGLSRRRKAAEKPRTERWKSRPAYSHLDRGRFERPHEGSVAVE